MSNRQYKQMQAYKCTHYEKMKKTSLKIHIQVNILKQFNDIYHSLHYSYIKRHI